METKDQDDINKLLPHGAILTDAIKDELEDWYSKHHSGAEKVSQKKFASNTIRSFARCLSIYFGSPYYGSFISKNRQSKEVHRWFGKPAVDMILESGSLAEMYSKKQVNSATGLSETQFDAMKEALSKLLLP